MVLVHFESKSLCREKSVHFEEWIIHSISQFTLYSGHAYDKDDDDDDDDDNDNGRYNGYSENFHILNVQTHNIS